MSNVGRVGQATRKAGSPAEVPREPFCEPASQASPADKELILAELQRVLASPDFDATDRNRKFLSYIVSETLAGRAERLKGYSIALAVFSRPETFDAATDPIVRVEAGRLRRSLDYYYGTTGGADSVHIEIPKGGYVPRFFRQVDASGRENAGRERADVASEHEASQPLAVKALEAGRDATEPTAAGAGALHALRRLPRWAAASFLGIVILAGALLALGLDHDKSQVSDLAWQRPGGPYRPSVLVLPFTAAPGTDNYLAVGITDEIINRLVPFQELSVFDGFATAFLQNASSPADWNRVGADYALEGTVRKSSDKIGISARLVDARTHRFIWAGNEEHEAGASGATATLQGIAARLAAAIGQRRGLVLSAVPPPVLSENYASFDCILRADSYMRQPSRDAHLTVRSCLEEAVRSDADYAEAWIDLAIIRLDEERYRFNRGTADDAEILNDALLSAQRAIALEPTNAHTHEAMGWIHWRRNSLDLARTEAEAAVSLNPNEPDLLWMLGLFLANGFGEWRQGIELSQRAIDLSAYPPSQYYSVLIEDALRRDDLATAVKYVDQMNPGGFYLMQGLAAAVYALADRRFDAQLALLRLMALKPDFAGDIQSQLYKRHLPDDVAQKILQGLRQAGLPASVISSSAAETN